MACDICKIFGHNVETSLFLDGGLNPVRGLQMIYDAKEQGPSLKITSYYIDNNKNVYEMKFDDLHYCPRCGSKII